MLDSYSAKFQRLALALLALLLFATSSPVSVPDAFALNPGDPAPEFDLPTNRNANIQLSALKGKVVLIDFWTAWCSKCQKSIAWSNALQQRLANPNFSVLAINLDETRDDALSFLAKNKVDLMVAFDPEGSTPEAFGIENTPASVIVDTSGIVRLIRYGAGKSIEEELESQISSLLAQ